MSLLKILIFPDTRLRTVADPIESVDDSIKKLSQDMLETMYAGDGVGLAATQVNIHKRLVVIDVSEEKNDPLILLNPEVEILNFEKKKMYAEGCLSVPGFYEEIERPNTIKIKATSIEGKKMNLKAEGMKSVVLQHEIDHLDGKMFVDFLSNIKRQRIRQKLLKQKKKK